MKRRFRNIRCLWPLNQCSMKRKYSILVIFIMEKEAGEGAELHVVPHTK
jgi:hypothetical protein